MQPDSGQLNLYISRLMIEELVRCGVDYFCLSPGSRCTPLTIAVAEHATARSCIIHDERAAAFHAVGYARATGRPAAVICTSGTAAANYLPAVAEASMDMVPLILLTADRPPELRDCGANQAIVQPGLYGQYVRWQADLPCPDANTPVEFFLTTIDQAVHRSHTSPCGPVHLNCMFREPFLPDSGGGEVLPDIPAVATWRDRQQPYTIYALRTSTLTDEQIAEASSILNSAASGVLIVGRLASDAERTAVERFGAKLDWPLLPDISSGLRLGAACDKVVPYYDVLVSSTDAGEIARPAVALHLGGRMVSKRLAIWLKGARFDSVIHVADHPFRHDWQHLVTRRYQCSPLSFCDGVTSRLSTVGASELGRQLNAASDKFGHFLRRRVDDADSLTEPRVARLVSRNTPGSSGIFVASSLSIRLMDSFAGFTAGPASGTPMIGCNRGASGIDGAIAAACGFAVGLDKPVTLLIGDLALLHDLNSLAIVRSMERPMTIVLLNNDGGGIFSLLSVAEREDVFEEYFATPHGLKFAAGAEQFGLDHHAPTTLDEFSESYRQAIEGSRHTLIEVMTRRADTRRLILDLVAEAERLSAES